MLERYEPSVDHRPHTVVANRAPATGSCQTCPPSVPLWYELSHKRPITPHCHGSPDSLTAGCDGPTDRRTHANGPDRPGLPVGPGRSRASTPVVRCRRVPVNCCPLPDVTRHRSTWSEPPPGGPPPRPGRRSRRPVGAVRSGHTCPGRERTGTASRWCPVRSRPPQVPGATPYCSCSHTATGASPARPMAVVKRRPAADARRIRGSPSPRGARCQVTADVRCDRCQLALSAVSSMTNEVWSLEPSTPVNLMVTVWPA